MNRLRWLVLAIAIGAVMVARPLSAQAPGDEPELARAVAAVLADSVLDHGGERKPMVWRIFSPPLSSAVGRILAGRAELRGPLRDPTRMAWMGIGDVTHRGDTARVLVLRGHDYGGDGELTFWEERTPYVFVRAGAGWRFVRREFTIHVDGGGVRGV
jgi:hypothetical protein